MSPDPMTELRDADPAREARPDPVEAEALLRRVLAVPPERPLARPRRRWALVPAGVACLLVAGAVLALLPRPGPGVAERAYAGMTPQGDTILHTVTVTGMAREDGTLARRIRDESWATATGRAREVSRPLNAEQDVFSETVWTASEVRQYSSAGSGFMRVQPVTAASPLSQVRYDTPIGRFREEVRKGRVREEETVTEQGRALTRLTTTSGRRVDYLVDPRTDRLVLSRLYTDEGRKLETRVLSVERLPLDRRTDDLLEMPPRPDVRIVDFG